MQSGEERFGNRVVYQLKGKKQQRLKLKASNESDVQVATMKKCLQALLLGGIFWCGMVELAGFEPASASLVWADLHV